MPGPFYVVDGCCLTCGVPEGEAPDHFRFDDDPYSGCYVYRQPGTPSELSSVINALAFQDVDCIRYRGSDPDVLKRLAAIDNPGLADFPPEVPFPIVFRNRVVFTTSDGGPVRLKDVIADFRSHWLRDGSDAREFHGPSGGVLRPLLFEVAWARDRHRVFVGRSDRDRSRVVFFQSAREKVGSRGVVRALQNWLEKSPIFGSQRWYSDGEWREQADGSPTPW